MHVRSFSLVLTIKVPDLLNAMEIETPGVGGYGALR